MVKELPKNEQQRIFADYKEHWCIENAYFKEYADVIAKFDTNELIKGFRKKSPPALMRYVAGYIYKKCISYKVKLKKYKEEDLGYGYKPGPLCINPKVVKQFTDDYASWGYKAIRIWNEEMKAMSFFKSSYHLKDWKWYISSPSIMQDKLKEIHALYDKVNSLLIEGNEMLVMHDEAITLEYNTNRFEISYREREVELFLLNDKNSSSDEEYCYVYTLECELFVFYVGIAANPKERFEQHIRGAFSDEAHLFKSKFIQKYHNQVKQSIVFEGTRRECRIFEKEYIIKYNPLGNMTAGGEG